MSLRLTKTFAATVFLFLAMACNLLIPNVQKIKRDLIGKEIGSAWLGWRFESLAEYERFEIVETNHSGDLVEYKVDAVLKDLDSQQRYTADLLISYRKENGEWKLVYVTDYHSLKLVKEKK